MSLTVSPKQIVAESNSPLLATAEGWSRIRLADVAEITNGFPFPSKGFNASAKGQPVIRIRDVGKMGPSTWFQGDIEDAPRVSRGEIVLGMDGDFRVARWLGPTALLNQRVCSIRVTRPDIMDERFLLLALPGYLAAINEHTSSVTVKHLSSRTVADIPLPLPSLSEQRRIVKIVEEHFSRLDAADAACRRARMMIRQLLMILHEDAARLTTTRRALGDLIVPGRKVAYGVLQPREHVRGGVPLIRVGDITDGRVLSQNVKMIAPSIAARFPRTTLRGGEVVLTIVGTIGRAAVVPKCLAGANVARAVAVIPIDSREAMPEFVSLVLNARSSQAILISQAHEVARKTLNLEDVRNFLVPVPGLDVQRAIVDEANSKKTNFDAALRSVDAAVARSAVLREAVLRAAFGGLYAAGA